MAVWLTAGLLCLPLLACLLFNLEQVSPGSMALRAMVSAGGWLLSMPRANR